MTEIIEHIWEYLALFGLAAAPWLEVFLVVPLGIAWGLSPIPVSIVGFIGNWIPVLLIGFFFTQISGWWKRRRARKLGISEEEALTSGKKMSRARKIWDRYGTPGLALIAPVIVGTDIAALLALAFGSSKRWVMLWITIGLAAWTVILAVGSYYGFGYIKFLKQG
ncbi:small multi-drug export protein [Paenibacillus ginsengihumi]|uniref:small multi-drug export protein n=1 Tax=Paenibacillus ginsengihumi TaxID=431596 RepID=UPI0003782DE1|nr:small multi-drug export protein [Paenibacillus ginsengihumi]